MEKKKKEIEKKKKMIRKSPAYIRKQENDSKKKLLAQKHLEKKIEEDKKAKENAGKQNSRWKVYTPGKRKTRKRHSLDEKQNKEQK